MGPMNYLVNKIITRFEDHRVGKERCREPRRPYTTSQPRSWSPGPPREPSKRRESYDERPRKHTDPDFGEVELELEGCEFQTKKVDRRDSSGSGRNPHSDSNLADSCESWNGINDQGDRRRDRDVSPRKSDYTLSCLKSKGWRESIQSEGNHRPPGRSRRKKRYQPSNNRIDKDNVPPVPPIPPQWTEEARNNAPHAPRVNNRSGQQTFLIPVPARKFQAGSHQQLQREATKTKMQKQAVDWDRLKREKNEQVSLAAEKNEWEAAGNDSTQNRERETAEKKREVIERKTACQCELEQAQKRKKAEEVEKRTNADSLLALEIKRVEAAKRANEARRMAAFGSIGQSNRSKTDLASPRQIRDTPRRQTEQQRRPPAWPNGASPAQTGGSGPQGRLVEGQDVNPAAQILLPVMSGQENRRKQLRRPARSNTDPSTFQRAANRAPRLKPNLPVVSPLTEENLRAQRGNFVEQTPVSELNRGLGDMTRTFIEGFHVPTELQSDVEYEGDDEEVPREKIN